MLQLTRDGATAQIEETGAEMRAYRTRDGVNRLWSGEASVWAGVAPILFPVIGNLRNQTVRIGGKAFKPPKHGFARDMRFQTVAQSPEACTLALEDTPETRAVFPFSFRLTVTHRLLERGFATTYAVENLGDSPMPFALGGHPGFVCPMNPGEAFSDYVVRFEEPEEGRNTRLTPEGIMGGTEIIPMGRDGRTLPLRHDIFDQKDTLVLAGLNSRSVALIHRDTEKGLRFSFPASPVLAIWSKPGANAPYVCLEPWNGLPAFADETGHFEDKPFHIRLEAGESFRAGYEMELVY